jgi:hypothetical protein
VAPRTPGIQDYFGPGSLLFFDPGDADGLANSIKYVAAQPREALEIAELGQQVYLAHTWNQERTTLIKLVGGLMQRRQAQ